MVQVFDRILQILCSTFYFLSCCSVAILCLFHKKLKMFYQALILYIHDVLHFLLLHLSNFFRIFADGLQTPEINFYIFSRILPCAVLLLALLPHKHCVTLSH